MMMKFIARVGKFLTEDHAPARERAYLNESTSIADVERRMREIDAGMFRNRRY